MNIEQMNAAKESMIDWLSHPNELGKPPAMIECAGTFDLHEMHYYIFKFKKRKLGAWLLGVCGGYIDDKLEHCGHVFSNMQEYYEKTAVIQATGMVEMIRSYWMNEAKKAEAVQEAEKEKEQKKGSFLGFVLLSENKWDKQQLIADFKEMWDIDATEDEKGTDVRENIFDYEWETTGKRIKVKDPIYNQFHTFEIWRVEIGGQTKYFVAGEFSNCVWGFFLEKNEREG